LRRCVVVSLGKGKGYLGQMPGRFTDDYYCKEYNTALVEKY